MKKRMVFIAMLLTMASSRIVLADSGVVNASSLRIRQTPSFLASTVGSLSKNTKVDTLGKNGDFYKINYKGKTGYVHSSYIKIVYNTSKPTIKAAVASAYEERYGVITAKQLNVRSGAGATYRVAGVVSLGNKVTMYEKSNGFYRISYLGKKAYISETYVKVTGEKTKSASTIVKTPVIIIPKVTPTSIEKYGVITAEHLNVRSGAGITYPVAGVIVLGNKVTMYEKLNGFYKINYCGKIGYISEIYVKVTGAKVVTTNSTSTVPTPVVQFTGIGTITTASLNVRKTAAIGSNVIGSINSNKKVNIFGMQGGYYKISYYGQWGYIDKLYVTVVKTPLNKSQYIINGQQYNAQKSINYLMTYSSSFLGTPYLWGGTTPAKLSTTGKYICGGFDCSGFIQYIYKNIGVNLPRTTMDQIDKGASVNINSLQKGDLIFFMTNSAVPYEASHVGIYIGNNKFMQAPKTGDVVKISELTGYYKDKFIIGKRIVK